MSDLLSRLKARVPQPGMVAEDGPAPKPKAEPKAEPKKTKASGKNGIGTLYIDCIPTRSKAEDLAMIIVPFCKTAAKQADKAHFGLVDHAQGGAAVAALLDDLLGGMHVKAVFCRSIEIPKEVLLVARQHAKEVIEGTR